MSYYKFESGMVFDEPAKQKVLTPLKIDKRGRVRFTVQCLRFEVTKNGLSVYDRTSSTERLAFFNRVHLSNETLLKIAEAVNMVNA